MKNPDKPKGTPEQSKRAITPARAAMGLAAAAAAAYGVYLLGAPGGRRRPATELANALGLRINYVPWGELHYAYYVRPGEGRPIILLHSINAVASAHEMKPLVERFVGSTRRPVFALEWLGFGHSDRAELDYTPAVMEDQLEHFLGRIAQRYGAVDVIGLSLGAAYAAGVARRRPDLIHSLVAIEPTGLGEEPSEIGRGWARLLFTLPGVQRAFFDRLTTPDALRSFARQNLFTSEFGVPEDFVAYGAETARVEGASRPLDDFLSGRMAPDDERDAFAHMRQPVLILHGTVAARRMESYEALPELERRSSVEVMALPTGALPHWERPDEVADRIQQFYANLPAASGIS